MSASELVFDLNALGEKCRAEREAAKAKRLAPYIEAALARKPRMKPLADHEIPVVKASVAQAKVNQGSSR